MNKLIAGFAGLALTAGLLVSGSVAAQKKTTTQNGKRQSAYSTTPQKTNPPASGYGTPPPSGYGNSSQQTAPPPSGYGAAGASADTTKKPVQSSPAVNIPLTVVAGGSKGLNDTVRPSLRSTSAIEHNLVKDIKPLAYEHIREDDAAYVQHVWRIIDAREKMNQPFRYSADENNGNQRFISILFNAINGPDSITAFSADDDRFTTPLTKAQVLARISGSGGFDTSDVTDINGNVVKKEVRARQIPVDSIYQFKISEEVIFDKESSRMFTRIVGIAPMMRARTASGIDLGDDVVLFWVYYPDLRPVLAKYEVYNPKNYGARMSWEELFEGRMFSSRIVKSTMDNPFDKEFKEYIKDPLFRLLQGEKVKEKIFSYEQNLWAY